MVKIESSKPMKIAFVSGKGGVGKSSLCFLTALSLRDAGKEVSVDDRDPQKSVSSWIDLERDGISDGGGEFTLIDTRPSIDHKCVIQAISEADRIVMPCTPSPGDITAARATVEVVLGLMKKGAKAALVLNMVKGGTNFAEDAPDLLKAMGVPVMNTQIPDRQSIQRAVLLGWRALDSKTQGIIFKLALEILS